MRKINELQVVETAAFAKRFYADKTTEFDERFIDHGMSVAAQTEKIATKLYADLRADYFLESDRDNIGAAVHCAILHDVLNVSACNFEQIAEATNVQIAAMIAEISRDFRLIETKRDAEFRGRVSQSPLSAQIVVVADAICNLKTMRAYFDRVGLSAVARLKKSISQIDGDLLAVQAANRYYVLRMYCHAAKNMLTELSQQIKERRKAAKIDKFVEKNTATLRAKVAAESGGKSKKTNPGKKEKRNGRK